MVIFNDFIEFNIVVILFVYHVIVNVSHEFNSQNYVFCYDSINLLNSIIFILIFIAFVLIFIVFSHVFVCFLLDLCDLFDD